MAPTESQWQVLQAQALKLWIVFRFKRLVQFMACQSLR